LPILFAIHTIFILGLSYPLAALNLFFHDVRFLVGVALTLWFYLTPVLYSVDLVPERYRIVYDLNPNSLSSNAYRRVLLHVRAPDSRSGGGLLIAVNDVRHRLLPLQEMEPTFADRI